MASKFMKRYSTPLAMREIPTKATVQYRYTSTGITNAVKDVKVLNLSYIAGKW